MKREKARLDELRNMSYADYRLTPEWQETQKAALGRAGNRCQVCRAEDVALNVHHTTYETVGCEQESDVIVLCEGCYDLCIQRGRLTHNDDTDETATGEEHTHPHFSLAKKALVFGPGALVGMGLPALLHAPLPAELFGLAAAIALAVNSPKIYGEMRDSLPAPLVELLDARAERQHTRATTGEWSNWDRLWGRHLRDDAPDHTEANDTTIIDEEDSERDEQEDCLDLGPTLQPHADRLLSGRKVILGTSGSGKTNTMNVYCEELGKLEPAPALLLFDTDDENRALCNRKYLPNPMWLDKSRRLTAENAFQAAHTILERRYQCIINLQSYEDEEAAWIMINMIKGVRAWQEAREVRVPCEIVLDEASVWLPQNPRESVLSSLMVDDPDALEEDEEVGYTTEKDRHVKKISLLALLQRAFFSTVVRRGRRRGMGFTLAAQRIAEIDKRALQGSWMFLMRQTQPADFREYQKFRITSEEAMALLDGEAFVFAPGSSREKHRLRVSHSPHGGVTPGMKALRGSLTGARGATRTPAYEPAPGGPATAAPRQPARGAEALATSTRPPAEQPGTQPAPKELRQELQQQHSRTINPALHLAYDAFQSGMHHHVLARRLGVTPVVAGHLLKQLRDHGYIDAFGNKLREQERKAASRAENTNASTAAAPTRPALYPLLRPTDNEQLVDEPKTRPITPGDLAKAFALWQAGASSVRKLEAAAKAAGYGWSNGMCRDLISAMERHGLIPKREASVL